MYAAKHKNNYTAPNIDRFRSNPKNTDRDSDGVQQIGIDLNEYLVRRFAVITRPHDGSSFQESGKISEDAPPGLDID